ncbi:MAG TPA: fumarylacetoacetate hydrolase family protein [Planctomycetota bacterium]|nr:fumarylacetoacetate hydrolase family protein [Planctomycetota bacterium]
MKYGTFQLGNRVGACLIHEKFVVDLGQAFFRQFKRPAKFPDLGAFLDSGGLEKVPELELEKLVRERTVGIPYHEVKMRAPLRRPPKIVCVGLNYKAHALEQKLEPPAAPMLFAKAANIVIGPGDDIEIPYGISEQIDYEVELAVVIGTPGFKIPRTEALDHIFGYTILNDVTARDVQRGDKQWFRGKSLATFCPMGPYVVTRDSLDHANASLSLKVNGEARQKSNTNDLIFNVPFLIEYISAAFPLEAGDIISTGTPGGVGMFMNPPRWLKKGDRVEATIDGIGTLTNTLR